MYDAKTNLYTSSNNHLTSGSPNFLLLFSESDIFNPRWIIFYSLDPWDLVSLQNLSMSTTCLLQVMMSCCC